MLHVLAELDAIGMISVFRFCGIIRLGAVIFED
jgi:hypothetical protein